MATWQHLRSSTANKRPTTSLADGRIAINTNTASPGLFFKDSAGTGIVKVGPVHVGTTAPNSSPAVGGSSGNYLGEQWLDTSVSPAQLKVWNGTTWVGVVADELPVSKLQDGAARQLIQTDAAGTGVEWTSNVDVPGTLDVTSTATFDSIAQHPLGNAAAPTITFTGDTNTGIYSPGADQLALSTNGTGRLFIDASGRLLLGTGTAVSLGGGTPSFYVEGASASTANGAILRTNGASTFSLARGSSGNNATATCGSFLFQGYDGAAYGVISSITASVDGSVSSGSTPGTLIFNTTPSGSATSTERLRITSAGLVGIGTSAPGALLECASSATNGPVVRLHNSSTSIAQDTEYGRLEWYSSDTSTGGTGISNYIRAYAINAGVRSALTFGVRHDSGVFEAMRLDNLGRLGIGTTASISPNAPLDDFHIASTDPAVLLEETDAGTDEKFWRIRAEGSILRFEGVNDAFNATTAWLNVTRSTGARTTDNIAFSTGTSERLRITSAGNVGIGTASPGNPLSVAGYGNATTGWSVGSEDGNTSGYLANAGSTSNSIELAADPNNVGANSFMQFSVDGSERARIDSSGRLLVGTSLDSGGALLQVNGDRIRVATAKTPASATDTGTAGEICWDANYIYVCTATNTWKRTAIATW